MILAAADCADNNAPPPVELEYAWNATTFGTLPYAGGQLDQPAGMLKRMRAAKNTYDAMMSYHTTKDLPGFIKSNPSAWQIVRRVLDMRKHGR